MEKKGALETVCQIKMRLENKVKSAGGQAYLK